jgi:hypothetical protein
LVYLQFGAARVAFCIPRPDFLLVPKMKRRCELQITRFQIAFALLLLLNHADFSACILPTSPAKEGLPGVALNEKGDLWFYLRRLRFGGMIVSQPVNCGSKS